MFGMDFDRAAKMAADYISQDASERCAKDLLTQIGFYGNIDFVGMREGGRLYAVRPEFFQEDDFEQFRFNPKETYFAYDTMAEPIDVKPNTDKGFAALNMFYKIRFVVDGETVYSEAFATSDDPDSESVQLLGVVVPPDGSSPYKLVTDIDGIARKLNHLLDLYAPYGVQQRSVIEYELDSFRKEMLRKRPLELDREIFDDLVLKQIEEHIPPLYRDAVSFRIADSTLYIQIPGRGESSLLGTRNGLLECTELYKAFCNGVFSLSEMTEYLLAVIDQRLSKWDMLKKIAVWDEVKDLVTLKKMNCDDAILRDIRLREADGRDFLPVKDSGNAFYVYRIYPYRDSDALKNRSFLVTGNIEKQWGHKLPGTKKIIYWDFDGPVDPGDDDMKHEDCILYFDGMLISQEPAG